PSPSLEKIEQAANIISGARCPLVMAGNGVIRAGASAALVQFAEKLRIPVATTFMAKGVIPFSHELSLGTVGLQTADYVSCGFDRADVIVCVGYDMVEYHPHLWHRIKTQKIIHIDALPAEVDEHYILEAGVIGDIGSALTGIAALATPRQQSLATNLREIIVAEMETLAGDAGFPIKPQKILWDLRQVLAAQDIVITDVGAHKLWMARLYQAEQPNTCIISNGFAAMGIAVPGALAAKLAHPERTVVAVTGDAGFLMNSQEIETALRVGTPLVILIWSDSEYGVIRWHQMKRFGRPSHIAFSNPDFVKYAQSFGAKGYRVESAADLIPALQQAIADNTVAVIDCPVDYGENMKLTKKLGELVCSI
ncbi:MAG: thiamine pyrophosphate-dependent enzyme, partial [Gammaproteobacteria bacterium]